jgi:hypothetical protein
MVKTTLSISSEKNKTRKEQSIGGDIHKKEIFKNILSIGYEFETSSLSKLTLISEIAAEGHPILLNTDTARKDLETFQKVSSKEDDEDEEEEEDTDFMLRQEEEVQFSAYDRNKNVDKNIAFLVTNDIVESPFIRSLNKMCKIVEEEKEDQIIDSEEYQKIKDKDDAKEYMALQKTEFKNTLYSFHEDSGKKYQINFVFHEKDVPLGLFSDVEWIFTYYKPKQSGSIIIDTFANAIFNLLMHIRDLKPIRGKLSLHTCLSKSKRECDVIAQKPEARILFHKPGTNLYYLQSHYMLLL